MFPFALYNSILFALPQPQHTCQPHKLTYLYKKNLFATLSEVTVGNHDSTHQEQGSYDTHKQQQ